MRMRCAILKTALIAVACLLTVAHLGDAEAVDQEASGEEALKTRLFTLPNEQGRTVLDAIRSARQSVDISIYTIGDELILQALKQAKTNGATIRLMVNGQNWISPANYPGHEKYDGVYALMCGYSRLSAPMRITNTQYVEICPSTPPEYPGLQEAPGPGRVMLHASSNNVALTHQKTILIDAADRSGRPLWPQEMLPTSRVFILTGNLSGWPWPNCASGGVWDPMSCPFYSARDFGLVIAEPSVIAEVERVFDSDWNCHSSCENGALLNEPVDRRLGVLLVWANGITGMPGTYPDCDNGCCPPEALYPSATRSTEGCGLYATGVYPTPLFGPAGSCGGIIQGNARRELLALIGAARKTLDVYNEEMADEQLVNALAAKAAEGVRVRVVMTEGNPHTYWSELQQREVDSFEELAQFSAQIRILPDDPSALYIHAKVILADVQKKGGGLHVPDHAAAYLGSENISTASLNQNRELGVILVAKHHKTILRTVAQVFERDFSDAPIIWRAGAWAACAPGTRGERAWRRGSTDGGPGRIHAGQSSAPLVCGPQGFPFPRPSQMGFGPWNLGSNLN